MLERIAEALEIDSPDLFSTQVFTDEAIKIVQDKVQADLDEVSISIKKKITEIKNYQKLSFDLFGRHFG